MRNHVVNAITEMAKYDDGIVAVVGDLGFNVWNKFEGLFPDRFINAGIAEQNMTAVAAGMALEGNTVFTYSIGNFPTLRCIEQIRNDICYPNANVKILSVGGGMAYGSLGMTHHATEDLAMMRALPNMRVYAPADAHEALACLEDAMGAETPAFIRMARGNEPDQHSGFPKPDVSKLIPMQRQEDGSVAVISTGTILSEAVRARKLLLEEGVPVNVFSCPRVKPVDQEGIRQISRRVKLVVTMEDHNIIGGLGGAVAEVMAEYEGNKAVLMRTGLRDTYTETVGSQEYLRDYYGLSAEKVSMKILARLKETL